MGSFGFLHLVILAAPVFVPLQTGAFLSPEDMYFLSHRSRHTVGVMKRVPSLKSQLWHFLKECIWFVKLQTLALVVSVKQVAVCLLSQPGPFWLCLPWLFNHLVLAGISSVTVNPHSSSASSCTQTCSFGRSWAFRACSHSTGSYRGFASRTGALGGRTGTRPEE